MKLITPKPALGIPRAAIFGFAAVASGLGHAARADGDLLSASSLGAGGAARADSAEAGAALVAPATLALADRYDLVGGARLASADDVLLQIAARDSHTSRVALGAVFTRWSASPPPDSADLPGWASPDDELDNPLTQTTLAVGLAGSWSERRFALGISGVRYSETSRFQGTQTDWELGLSLAGRPVQPLELSLGALHWMDLFGAGDDEHTFVLGAGAAWQIAKPLRLLTDAESALTTADAPWTLRGGLEARLLESSLALRAGAQRDGALQTNFLTAGVGLKGGAASLDYGLRADVGADGGAVAQTGARMWHALSLQISVPDF